MSNVVVGSVYEQIIKKVIEASQNDFEEFGVAHATLEELKNGWQDKLSALKVAAFPWDPIPEPPRQPITVPSNVKPEDELLSAGSTPQTQHVNFPNVAVKTEQRGYEPPLSAYPQAPHGGYTSGYNGEIAQQRAHALVAQRMHGQQQQLPQQQHHPGQMQMPPQQQQQPPQQPPQQQQQRMMDGAQMQHRPQQPMQQMPPQSAYKPRTDGESGALEDWAALVESRAAIDDQSRIEADQFMRARVDALASRLDSGLMMPLNKMPKGKRRNAAVRVLQEDALAASGVSVPARFDGGDEEEKEHDSDAINSDLDDSEDERNAGEDSDDETMDYMLCTYDKVQRVKNKWKCTLKDGILTTNKREYLFHKANGEFEW